MRALTLRESVQCGHRPPPSPVNSRVNGTVPQYDGPLQAASPRRLFPSSAPSSKGTVEEENGWLLNDSYESFSPASATPANGLQTSLGKALEKIRLSSGGKTKSRTLASRSKTSGGTGSCTKTVTTAENLCLTSSKTPPDKIIDNSVSRSTTTKSIFLSRDVRLQDAKQGDESIKVVTDRAGSETNALKKPTDAALRKIQIDNSPLAPSSALLMTRTLDAGLLTSSGRVSPLPRSQHGLNGTSLKKSPPSRKEKSPKPKAAPSSKQSPRENAGPCAACSLSYYRKLVWHLREHECSLECLTCADE